MNTSATRIKINYVIDMHGWVQDHRAAHLMRHQDRYDLKVMTMDRFLLLWRFGMLRRQPTFFCSWRSVHAALLKSPRLFKDRHFEWFLGAVTSHSNIGGGLDPHNPIPNRTREEAYELATGLLRRFAVVTANSRILQELLEPALPDILYCPTGVDTTFFTPETRRRPFDPKEIRIGWVGKERGPKNFAVVRAALDRLESEGPFKAHLIHIDKSRTTTPLDAEQMRAYYGEIDFYLCASWNEGTPNPALEAGASGVPVISTKVGNMRELIQPGINGLFVEPTVDNIVETISGLRDVGPARYDAMSSAMREEIVRNWAWPARIANFTEALDRLVGATPTAARGVAAQ